MNYCQFFGNRLSFALSLRKARIMFIKKTLIYSKMDELVYMKMVKNNINFRIKMKKSFYFIELQLVLSNSLSFAVTLIRPKNNVYLKNIDFLEDGRINSHENT